MVKMLTNRRTKAPARFNGSQCQWSTNGQSSSWSFSNLKIGLRKPKKQQQKKQLRNESFSHPEYLHFSNQNRCLSFK